MVKRFIPFLLVLLLLPCLIVPAFATTADVVDELETQTTYLSTILDACNAIGRNLQSNFQALQNWLGFSSDYSLYDGLKDMFQSLGDGLGERFDDVVDRLDWLDDSVRDVETGILDILEQLYTNGALTIGEYVKGIRTYIVSIDEKLTLPVGGTIGGAVGSINEFVFNIYTQIQTLVNGNTSVSQPIVDNAQQTTDDLEDLENILATSPTIDDSGVDSAITGVNGKFQNITTDADGTLLFGALGEIAKGNIFGQIVPTSAMLGVLSFALFGRVF